MRACTGLGHRLNVPLRGTLAIARIPVHALVGKTPERRIGRASAARRVLGRLARRMPSENGCCRVLSIRGGVGLCWQCCRCRFGTRPRPVTASSPPSTDPPAPSATEPRSATPPARSASKSGSASTPAKSNDAAPNSPASPCTSPVASAIPHSPARCSCHGPSSISSPARAQPLTTAANTNSRASPPLATLRRHYLNPPPFGGHTAASSGASDKECPLGARSTEPSRRTEHGPAVSPECSDDGSRRAAPDHRLDGAESCAERRASRPP